MFCRKRVLIKELLNNSTNYLNSNIKVCGWIETMRVQKGNGIGFISLNDGSTITSLQILLNPCNDDELKCLNNIYDIGTKGVSIEVIGLCVKSPAQGQNIEINAKNITIFGKVKADEYPIAKKKLSLEHIRKFPHLRIKTRTIASIMNIRNKCSKATHDFFQSHNFNYVHTPIITSNDCEGAGETFNIDNKIGEELFFNKKINLTVSGQLHGETYAHGLGDIYTFGPTFRAENSNTSRHLAEFWMIEPEMCFIDFNDLINISEDYLKFCINYCLNYCIEELQFLNKNYDENLLDNLEKYIKSDFKRLTYNEVIDILLNEISNGNAIVKDKTIEHKKFKKISRGKHIFETPIYDGCDLASEHEKYITDKIIKGPLIITDYPKSIKSFYMKENNDNKTVQAMDILIPNIGELIGGSMRESCDN